MSEWLQGYLREAGCDSLHADIPHHSHFYSVCQALFYVFCFRSQELLDTDAGDKVLFVLPTLQHVVCCQGFVELFGHVLNPVKVCSQELVLVESCLSVSVLLGLITAESLYCAVSGLQQVVCDGYVAVLLQMYRLALGSALASPDVRATMFCMHAIHHLHPCPHPTCHSHD